VQRSDRRPIEAYEAAALEDAIDDRLPEILIEEDASPRLQRLVGREDHRAVTAMPLVDHVKEHVRGIGAVREIPHLVDHQDRRMCVGLERLRELPLAKGGGQIIDQRRRGGEESVEAVLDRAVRDRDCQVRFPAAGLPEKINDRPSVTKSGASAEPSMCSRSDD
jgi:hypothetical protein